jgi:YVTN family beta-propeller protein
VDLTERGFSPNAKPHDIAVGPDGDSWYVSLIGANRVLKMDRYNEIIGRATFEAPGLMELDPQSGRLFVGRSMGAVNPPKSIGILDADDPDGANLRILDVFFPRPHALGIDPSGQQVYVASLAQNQVAALNAESGQMELTSMSGPVNTLVHFAVSPDGRTLAAGGQVSGTLFFFDVDSENPLTPTVTDSVQLGGQPWHPIYTPDGSRLYVPQKTADAVTVLDAQTHEVVTTIRHEALAQPHGSTVSADGRYVYVTASNTDGTYTPPYADAVAGENRGAVVVIDTHSNEVIDVIPADQDPSGLDL